MTVQAVVTGYDRLRQATSKLRSVIQSPDDSRASGRDAQRYASDRQQTSKDDVTSTARQSPTPGTRERSPDATGPEATANQEKIPVPPQKRVLRLLDGRGDWMWQTNVVDDLDLSASTVSRHVSSLEDQGRVKRVSIGRHKVIGTPDADLEDIDERTSEN
jgi:DNA-binding transcriptional ArsR family regulator